MAERLQQAANALKNGNATASVEKLQQAMNQALQQIAQTNSMLAQMSQSIQGLQQSQMVLAAASPGAASPSNGMGNS
ncbi:hypothetical protein MXD62_09275, partial [Frankia sp. Mgl5]